MLKTLSLSPDENRDESLTDNSESRMLRALEALSSQPQPRDATDSPPSSREQNPFRSNKPASSRDGFRNEQSHHTNKARHRFVKDGEVPVVHMSPARPHNAASPGPTRNDPEYARLQQGIEEQRQRADQAERARAEAQAQFKILQTKLAHTDLTLADAQALAQARMDEINGLLQRLNALQPAAPVVDAPRRGPGRPRRVVPDAPEPAAEPEPVQWWLVAPKAKRRG